MKTFALNDGDLVVTSHGHETVSGAAKVKIELTLALNEVFGTDRFHPQYGSYLQSFVGQTIGPELQFAVEAEVIRVLNAYITIQKDEILRDKLYNVRSRFSTADVVQAITNVETATSLDRIYIRVSLITQAQEVIDITKSVGV